METVKITYMLELEVPAEALITDGDAFVQGVRQMLRWNAEKGWKAHLRRLVGVDRGGDE